mmetsp:Transcript_93790/g.162313  ORF Transcript_93790/g.162313 Transcript_93790/m.162313 type:complete len:451 (-) Transcript_93790:42-1394(-)
MEVTADGPSLNEFSIFQAVDATSVEVVMRLASKDVYCTRAMGALVGMAVADAVGGHLEFIPVGQQGSFFNPKTLRVHGEKNKFQLKAGQWTDDSAMGLCLADSLLVRGGYDGADTRIRFWNWWHRGYNNAFRLDESRVKSVGLGGNIGISLISMSQGAMPEPRFHGLGEDAGNGSLMRLAPVPVYYHRDLNLAMRVSAESSYTTHPGASAADACAFLGYLVARAITRKARRRETAAHFLDDSVWMYLQRPETKSQPVLKKLLESCEKPGSQELCWNWRDPRGPFLKETLKNRGRSYKGYRVDADYFGSYSMDGLAIALHSFYHTKTFMEAITRCVNFLGDADSTGAICGQIAGAFYGYDHIDARLVTQLRQWDQGEIALRGALLYVQGSQLSEKEEIKARQKCALCDRDWRVETGVKIAPNLPELPEKGAKPKQPPSTPRPTNLLRRVSI